MTAASESRLTTALNLTKSRPIRMTLLVVALAILPFIVPFVELGIEIVIYALALVGLDLIVGYTGLVSFGHAAYFGAGAYATALFTTNTLGSGALLPTLVVAVLVATFFGVVFGYLSLRRTGVYFAMLTLATGELLYFVVQQFSSITGGTDGLTGIPTPELAILRPVLDEGATLTGLSFYAFTAVLLFVGIVVARRIASSPFGLALTTIRENEERAKFLGYNTGRYKFITFVVSAIYCGVAGALLAFMNSAVSLSLLHWSLSGDFLIMLILGGMGSVFGPAIGAFIVITLEELLSAQFAQSYQLYTGTVFILFVLFLPHGLWNLDWGTLQLGRQRLSNLMERISDRLLN